MDSIKHPVDQVDEEFHWYSFCWNYFSLLSGQRMQMLEYYISLEIFLQGAFITLVSLNNRLCWAEATVASLSMFISIVFFGLDYRTKTMIHECEKAMVEIEQKTNNSSSIKPIMKVNSCSKAKITYSKWIIILQLVFFVTAGVGLLLVVRGII